MEKWYVYKLIRIDKNQVFYIGIGSSPNFARAYSKDDRNDIWKKITNKTDYKVEILYENISFDDAKDKEIQLIKEYGKIKNGGTLSNMTDGGDGISGYIHTDETKKVIKEKRKYQVFSQETKDIWSKNRMGNKKAFGKKHSPEKNNNKSINQRGKFGGIIIRTDEKGNSIEFMGIKNAAESIGVSYKDIWYACIKRHGKIYKGFYWMYKDTRQLKNNDVITEEFLYQEYVVGKKSGDKIGKELNCSGNKIYRLLKKYNLM